MKNYLRHFNVYHAKNPAFGFGKDGKFPEDFELIATVEAENPSEAFYLTNHINASWTKNEGIVKLYNTNPRSTSVGDVVEDDCGMVEVCMPFGWKALGFHTVDANLIVPGNLYI